MIRIISSNHILSAFIFLLTNLCFSQVIEGVIYSEFDEKLPQCNILIKDLENQLINHSISKQDGSYSIEIKPNVNEFSLEFTKIGFDKEVYHFKTSEIGDSFSLDVTMFESVVKLDSVNIVRSPRIQIKKDTVSYKADAFLDGTEQKVEDLLRNIPGIQVEADGLIKYRGKFIEKVLLDGDDLFDMNYTVGTKNMNVDIVDRVEAIENFSENALLSGIEDSDKVALNLKLKKNIIDFSGNASFAYGIENRNQADLNALIITNKNKNFSSLNYNNTGENYSPYDFFSNQSFVNRSFNESLRAPKLISEPSLSNRLESSRSTINDNWFNSINHIYKISNRLNLRFIFAYYQDQLNMTQSILSNYVFDDGANLNTSQQENTLKKPEVYTGNLKLSWNSSNKSLLEFFSSWNKENIRTYSDLFTNYQNDLNTSLYSKSFFTQQKLLFTQKLNERHAIQIQGAFSHNESPQEFNLHPGLDILSGQIALDVENQQLSNFLKNNWQFETTFFGLNQKDKYHFSAFVNYKQNQLKTELFQNNQIINEFYINDLEYDILQTNFEGEYNFEFNRLEIKPNIKLKNYFWKRNERTTQFKRNSEKFVFSPSLNVKYKLNNLMNIFGTYKYDETPIVDSRLYTSYVLTSNRSVSKNEFSNKFQNKHQVILGYNIHDMYRLLALNFNLNYIIQKNNFLVNTFVTEDLTRIEYSFLPDSNKSFSTVLSVEKFFPVLESTLKLSGVYTNNQYKNIVNYSDFRENKLEYYQFSLYGKSAFKLPINFENEFKVSFSTSQTKNIDHQFKSTYINNTFKLIVKPYQYLMGTFNFDYYSFNQKQSTDYYFLDASIRYLNPNTKFTYSLIAKNISNNKDFKEVIISDYYESYSSQVLNKAYLLLGIGFSF